MDGENSTGVYMRASSLTGQDTTGLNDGSKSTTLVNYLSDAWNWGAEMFCECEVRYVTEAPDRDGYLVHFAWHGGKRANFSDIFYEDLMWVHAKELVFFGAGSIGSTEILLRSKKMGLEMSSDVGHGMSGNGDILAFGWVKLSILDSTESFGSILTRKSRYNTNEYINSVGRPSPPSDRPVGPCITGVIDCRDQGPGGNPLDGFVIEEGAVPAALAPFYDFMLANMPSKIFPSNLSVKEKIEHVAAAASSVVLGPYNRNSSTEKTQCYLIMSHDSKSTRLMPRQRLRVSRLTRPRQPGDHGPTTRQASHQLFWCRQVPACDEAVQRIAENHERDWWHVRGQSVLRCVRGERDHGPCHVSIEVPPCTSKKPRAKIAPAVAPGLATTERGQAEASTTKASCSEARASMFTRDWLFVTEP